MATDLQSRSLYLVVVEVSSLIVLNLLSLMENTLVCISVYRNTLLLTTTNLYITALAVSDLLSAVFVMPLTIGVLVSGHWIFGCSICRLRFTSNDGADSAQSLCANVQARPRISEVIFNKKVTGPPSVCLAVFCLLQ